MVGVAMKVTRRGSLSVSNGAGWLSGRIGRSKYADEPTRRRIQTTLGAKCHETMETRNRMGIWNDGKGNMGGSYLRQARVCVCSVVGGLQWT